MKKTLFHCLVVFLLGFGLVIRVFSQTWEWINPLPQGNTLRAVKFIDAGTAVAVGDAATVMRTTDGGETWDIAYKVTGISRSLRGLSFYGQKGIAVGDTGTVITTDDGGLTWERRESGTTRDLLSVSMPDDSLAVAVGYHGIILRSTDGGVTWQQQEIEIGITEDLTAVTFVDSFGVAVGNWGSILLSYDAGVTWLRLEYPGLPWFTDVFFLNQDYGFILELSAGVFRTTDGGENWSLYRLDTEGGLYAIDFYDDSRGMIAGTYGLFMTADSGKTWSPVASGIESTLRGLDVENDGAGIAVGLGGSITTKSYDAENWTPRSQGLTWSLKDLAFVNADTGIAVASNNLVYTFDGGKTWAPLADTVLCCLNAIDFFDENRGTVAGSFRLIYRTDDGGKTWRKQETPLRYNLTFLDVFHVTVDTVYAVGE
ncbi:MAG: WD40/YVTN/BNR-like repeat-containing protein, partial [bacterium]